MQCNSTRTDTLNSAVSYIYIYYYEYIIVLRASSLLGCAAVRFDFRSQINEYRWDFAKVDSGVLPLSPFHSERCFSADRWWVLLHAVSQPRSRSRRINRNLFLSGKHLCHLHVSTWSHRTPPCKGTLKILTKVTYTPSPPPPHHTHTCVYCVSGKKGTL